VLHTPSPAAWIACIGPYEESTDLWQASHAATVGLSIDYRLGVGENLPLEDASVDIACCVDVLEHVNDIDTVIGDTARVVVEASVGTEEVFDRHAPGCAV